MKKLLYTFLTLLTLALVLSYALAEPVFMVKSKPDAAQAQEARMHRDVLRLTGTSKPRNYRNIEALEEAAAYITAEMQKAGYEVQRQSYKVDSTPYSNLIWYYGPEDGKRVVVGAHYDVCGDQPGADDNASGVAGLLELARLLQEHKPQLNYRVEMVAYTLEEPPFFDTEYMGSYVHAQHLHQNKVDVRAMICLEMLGFYSEEKNSQHYPVGILKAIYPSRANFIAVVGRWGGGGIVKQVKRHMKQAMELDVRSINAPPSLPGIDLSDHLNYWHFDYPAVMITNTSFYRNKNYHEATDLPETLNYKNMAQVASGVYNAVVNFK